jgi:HEPN domain-containing protein
MPGTDPTVPSDWLARGDLDFEAAEILLTQAGPLSMVAFHILRAIEKYLKGFLIHTGWHLRSICRFCTIFSAMPDHH